ncbi:MAG: TIR domain-containing protein [Acidimicrobiia bacterium]
MPKDPETAVSKGRAQDGDRAPVVFLSYRRDDTEGHAGHLGEWLVRRFGRDNVFRDVDSVRPGEDFVAKIGSAIRACDVVLVLIGRHWLTTVDRAGQRRIDSPRDYVRLEIEAALENGIRTIPVLLQNAQMPAEEDLPASIATLARLQASVIASGRWNHDVEVLLQCIAPAPTSTGATEAAAAVSPASVVAKARELKRRLDNWPHPLPEARAKPPVPAAFCRRCGQDLSDTAKFCRKCGTARSTER